ncbi:MAG: hypothetical protein R3321_08910, partial [Nitrososphaeraceae archaeon]|nr:hypothetical protein [Nitrososphaeraceae archaeon]
LICQKIGIIPDVVIGDIDSSGLKESAEKIIIIYNDDKKNILYEVPKSKIFTGGLCDVRC